MSRHRCTALGCQKTRSADQVFCKPHWFKLPRLVRDEIWAAYRTGDRIASLTIIRDAVTWLQENDDKAKEE